MVVLDYVVVVVLPVVVIVVVVVVFTKKTNYRKQDLFSLLSVSHSYHNYIMLTRRIERR